MHRRESPSYEMHPSLHNTAGTFARLVQDLVDKVLSLKLRSLKLVVICMLSKYIIAQFLL